MDENMFEENDMSNQEELEAEDRAWKIAKVFILITLVLLAIVLGLLPDGYGLDLTNW